MILANDGVFNDGGYEPGVSAGVLSDLENSVVSAFNRGIADTFAIAPNNWAAEPSLNSATATAGSGLSVGTYYYVITATNTFGETTTSIERAATTTTTDGQVTLSWTPEDGPSQSTPDGPTQFNIYRSTTPGSGYQLVGTQLNNGVNPAISYTDSALPERRKRRRTTMQSARWRTTTQGSCIKTAPRIPRPASASMDWLTASRMTIKEARSTNFQANFSAVQINLMPWGTIPTPGPGPTPTHNVSGIEILSQPISGVIGV